MSFKRIEIGAYRTTNRIGPGTVRLGTYKSKVHPQLNIRLSADIASIIGLVRKGDVKPRAILSMGEGSDYGRIQITKAAPEELDSVYVDISTGGVATLVTTRAPLVNETVSIRDVKGLKVEQGAVSFDVPREALLAPPVSTTQPEPARRVWGR